MLRQSILLKVFLGGLQRDVNYVNVWTLPRHMSVHYSSMVTRMVRRNKPVSYSVSYWLHLSKSLNPCHYTPLCGCHNHNSRSTENDQSICSNKLSVKNPGTVIKCVTVIAQYLDNLNISEADESAQYIVAQVLGKKTLHLIISRQPVSDGQWEKMRYFSHRRSHGMPIQYVLGEWDFCDFTFDLHPPVLIPRPETEELVSLIRKDPSIEKVKKFVEIGAGSGAICISLLKYFQKLECVAVDISSDACALTEHNARKAGVLDRLHIYHQDVTQGDVLACVPFVGEKYDFVVSNPPYICTKDMNKLQTEIINYEDPKALDGGVDGMTIIKCILKLAPDILINNGSLWMEVDSQHPDLIETIIKDKEKSHLIYLKTYKDFNKMPRFVHIRVTEHEK